MTGRGRAQKTRFSRVRALLLCIGIGAASASNAESLPGYGADASQTSVSGLSSGAFMAAQFDVAWSEHLVGVGVVAGGPFYCAGLFPMVKPVDAAQTNCMNPLGDTGPKAEASLDAARRFYAQGKIDDPSGLAKQRVYVFSGTNDKTVTSRVVAQVQRFYRLAGTPASNIRYVDNIAAGHALITKGAGDLACGVSKGPYINNCGFEQSNDILRWIYGNLNEPAASATGQLSTFDQREFDPTGDATLWSTGYVYVPAACSRQGSSCKVHVAFHGCLQSAEAIGDRYVRETGYNEIADTNRIIVLYPQVEKSAKNPLGCWDFWGYTSDDPSNPDFFSRKAPQIAAVMRIVQRLEEAPR